MALPPVLSGVGGPSHLRGSALPVIATEIKLKSYVPSSRGPPSLLALVDGTSSVAEAGGGPARHTRA